MPIVTRWSSLPRTRTLSDAASRSSTSIVPSAKSLPSSPPSPLPALAVRCTPAGLPRRAVASRLVIFSFPDASRSARSLRCAEPACSASPVASDGKIYLPNEDGEILVVAAGEKFAHLGTNSMGELLMATPALSQGVMYVRTAQTLFAVGHKK